MNTHKFSAFKGLLLLLLFPMLSHAQVKPFSVDQLDPVYRASEAKASPVLKQVLVQQRKFIADKKLDFHVANTQVSELHLKDITGMLQPSADDKAKAVKVISDNEKVINAELADIIKKLEATCHTNDKDFDARNAHIVPDIRDQQCGDCWAYSSVGALEISYFKVAKESPSLDLSEKQVVACSGAGSCSGGWPYLVCDWLTKSHTRLMDASQDPDNGQNGPCLPVPKDAHVQLVGWGLVDPAAGLFNIASVDKIKEAICKYGSVSCAFEATPLFQNYAGHGVFKETESTTNDPQVNHAIVLIGWDDSKQAWLLLNSWGTNWGDKGYAWIGFHTNNIGFGAIWEVAKK